MKLVDSLQKYPKSAVETIMMRVKSISNTIEEGDAVLIKELEEPTPPQEGDNVYHVNFQSFTEYLKSQGEPVTIPELLDAYEKWTDVFWELAKANVGHYHNKKVVAHVLSHRKVIETFGNFLAKE